MNQLWTITIATFRMLIRNKQSLFFTWVLPLSLMLVIGFMTQSSGLTLNLGVIYNHSSQTEQQLVDVLSQVDSLKITTGTAVDEQAALADNKRDLVVQLPDDIQPQAQTAATVTFYENVSKPAESNIGKLVVTQVLQQFQAQASGQQPWFTFTTQKISSQNLRYIDFLVPGIIAMTIMQLGVFGTAFALVDAKQKGVLKRVMATPVAAWQYIIGNMIARLWLSLTQAAILVAVASWVFGVQFHHWLWLISLIVLGNIVFLSLGLFISGVAKTTETVPVLGNLIVFPMLLLGGIFFQTSSLPDWLKLIVDRLPVALLADLMRNTVTMNKTLAEVWPSLLTLAIWAVFVLWLANTFFKMQERE